MANLQIVEATHLQNGNRRFAIAQLFARKSFGEFVDLHRLRRNLSSPQDIALIVAKRNRNLTYVLIDSKVQHDGGAPIVGEKVTTLPEYAIGKPILLEKLTLSQTHKHQSVQRLADQSSSFPLPRVQVTNDFPFAEVILTDSNGNSPRHSGRCNRCHEADRASIAMA